MNGGLACVAWAAAAVIAAASVNAQEVGLELAPLPSEGTGSPVGAAPPPGWRLGDVSVGHVVASRSADDLAGVATASSTVEYRFDDGTFEGAVSSELLGIGVAQSFTLDRPGEVEWVEGCWRRTSGDDEDRHRFRITIHEDGGGEPGSRIRGSADPGDLQSVAGAVLIENMPVGQVVCAEAANWEFETVPAGTYWIVAGWVGTEGLALLAGQETQLDNPLGGLSKELMLDLNGAGATNVLAYEAAGLGDIRSLQWAPLAENPRAAAIRFRVEFKDEDSDDDGDDDNGDDDDRDDGDDDDKGDDDDHEGDGDGYPETPTGRGFSNCVPTGPALGLADGFRVSLCFDDPNLGEQLDARDWRLDATDSGLLYFFERNNVEVLIKVLNGCQYNNHYWVFVAPVTDLAFNLHVDDGKGNYWTHRNRAGETAEAKRDTSAFDCE